MIPGRKRSYPCLATKSSQPEHADPSVMVGRPSSESKPRDPLKTGSKEAKADKSNTSPIPFVWVIALLLLLVASVAHMALVCSSNRWLGLGFLPALPRLAVSSSSVRKTQLFYLLAATSQIVLWEWIAVTTTFAFYAPEYMKITQAQGFNYQMVLLFAHLCSLACSVLLWGWLGVQITANFSLGKSSETGLAVSVMFALIFVIWTAAFWWLLLHQGTTWTNPLGTTAEVSVVARRTMYFLEGLSPVVPVFFVLLAYYLWSLNSLRRLSMVVTRVSVSVPRNIVAAKELAEMVLAVQVSIRRGIDVKSFLVLGALTVTACSLLRLTTALRGFEMWFQPWLVSWGFVLLLLIIMAMLYRSWDIWSRLRRVLHFLDAAMLGRAFSHVPKELSSMRIWSVGSSRASLMVQVRTAELLQRMNDKYLLVATGTAQTGTPVSPPASRVASLFSKLWQMARIARANGIVERSLAREVSALLNQRMPQTGFLFDLAASAPNTIRPGEKQLLELYVAYRFVALFRYVMRQLRNTLTFVIYGYACLVVGTSSYPFQGRQTLGTLMSFVFVLLLGGVAVMMVQMYQDPILKRLEESVGRVAPGTFDILTKVIGVAGVPLVAVLASQFPSVAEVLLSWVRPLVEASH